MHTGALSSVSVRPAGVDRGLVVTRRDDGVAGGAETLHPQMVGATRLCTGLTTRSGSLMTVEHLLSALTGLGIDNAIIEVTGPEIPALDGSAEPFVDRLDAVGITKLDAPRRVLRVTEPIEVALGDSWARLEPYEGYALDVSIAFDNGVIGDQHWSGDVTPAVYRSAIAPARTFAFLPEVEALRASGLALGGSLDNCVVIDGEQVMNPGGLRFDDEFVRHKALDVIGDLSLVGLPLLGRYRAHRPGHALNNAVARALLADRGAHQIAELEPETPARRRRAPAGLALARALASR